MTVRTRLREIRKSRAVSASDLARFAGVTRQTIYAIEDGSFVPNTAVSLRLGRALNVSVEELFSLPDENPNEPTSARLLTENQAANQGQMVRLCRVNHRLVAVPISLAPAYLPTADGVITSKKKSSVSVQSAAAVPDNGKRLLLAGCDPALSLLNELLASPELDIVSVPSSSRRALDWLKRGCVHAAGSHLYDTVGGDYNLPLIRRLFPSGAVRVVTFATWEQGLVLQHGNPKDIRSLADLGRKNISIVNREKGAGSRHLLDTHLRKLGIQPQHVKGYESTAPGHLAAAHAIALGTADCCIAPRSAARCFGLDFIPLAVERFDLSFTRNTLELPAAKALLDLLNRADLRRKLQAIAGYDTTHTGEILI